MTTETPAQCGLLMVDCSECEKHITGEVYEGLGGEKLCEDCFDNADLVKCSNCSKTVERDDCQENPGGDLWCEGCVDEDCITCEHCDNLAWANDSSTVITRNGRWGSSTNEIWCDGCVDNHSFICNDCGYIHDDSESTPIAGGSNICQGCYEDYYFTCENCGIVYHNDDMYCSDAGCYCDGCRPCGENFGPSGFRDTSGSVTEIGSARCYGIELETDGCDGYEDLDGSPAWGAKDDPSISGKEFYSDILSGDAGLDAVRDWSKLARCNGWHATDSAGYHLHIDMRKESDDQLYGIAYAYRATQEVWLKFVDPARSNGTYSNRCVWTCADIDAAAGKRSFYSWCGHGSRYHWFNTNAYRTHSTFEIRAHEGTCDDTAVINWVKAHTRFADWASTLGYDGVKEAIDGLDDDALFNFIADEAWQDDELRNYYADKARNH